MGKPKIELITCDSGDWEVLRVDGEVFTENHRLSNLDWIRFLNRLGYQVKEVGILDEDMEMGNY
jgi:hypothetical protein